VYQFREGNVIRSKGLGSAARVTPAQARRAREAFAVGAVVCFIIYKLNTARIKARPELAQGQ